MTAKSVVSHVILKVDITVYQKWWQSSSLQCLSITPHQKSQDLIVKTFFSSSSSRPVDIVGELQFAFVSCLVGQSWEAFEHWKRLVVLLCSCDDAISKCRAVYDAFLSVLEAQLSEISEDFLVDIVAGSNFVYQSLRALFRTIQLSETVDDRLKSKAKRLQERLTVKFQWDFTCLDREDDEDAPVVVNI